MERLRTDYALAVEEQRKEQGFEAWLVNTLGPYLPIFQRREFLYASIESKIHRLRDRVFRIDTRTKRPILKSRYLLSMQFFELSLWIAHEQGIKVLLYNVPLRQEVENPYVADEYERFRRDLAVLAADNGAEFGDYDSLIPRELWGTWYATDFPDFSHFTAAGHRILAERVQHDIAGLLNRDEREQRASQSGNLGDDAIQ